MKNEDRDALAKRLIAEVVAEAAEADAKRNTITLVLTDRQMKLLRELKAFKAGETPDEENHLTLNESIEAVDIIAANNDGRTGGFSRDMAISLALQQGYDQTEEGIIDLVFKAMDA